MSIGTELLLGTITDTNASYLAGRLAALGIDCHHISAVGDNQTRIEGVLRTALERSDLIVATGGLGPTPDDLTREAIAGVLGEEMAPVAELEQHVRDFFSRRKSTMPAANLKQATLIPSASAIPNPIGSAPGWWVTRKDGSGSATIVAMPGVPFEMKRMWEREIEPRLQGASGDYIVSRTLKVLGHGESAVAAKVADLFDGSNPTLAPYAKQDGIHLRITAKSRSKAEADAMIAGLEAQVRARLGNSVYGADEDTPAGVVSRLLAEGDLRVALVEIGPFVAGALTPLFQELDNRSRADLALIALDAEEPANLFRLFGWAEGGAEGDMLGAVLSRLLISTGAEVALGVQATANGTSTLGSVEASVRLGVVMRGSHEAAEAVQQWTTAPDQVKRLAGLAAYNMLRLRLLEQGNRAK